MLINHQIDIIFILTGGFLIIADYDIEASRAQTVSQKWNVEVTFVNLDTDQVKNI